MTLRPARWSAYSKLFNFVLSLTETKAPAEVKVGAFLWPKLSVELECYFWERLKVPLSRMIYDLCLYYSTEFYDRLVVDKPKVVNF